jgi:DNA polymerase III subunit epsilon
MKIKKELIVFDLETTGTWIEKDRIVEIGMVKLFADGSRHDYVKRVNPGMPIPLNVSRIIDITNDDVKDAPRFEEIAKEVFEFIGNADLGGFNIQRFDLPVLEREFLGAGISFHWKDRDIYDAQKVYHIHEKRDLMAAYKFYCQKDLTNAHTALGDAEATMQILEAQITRYGNEEDGIESLRDFDYEQSSAYFDSERKFCWWNNNLYPAFGKYRRKRHIKEIAKNDRSYLEWLLHADFSDEVKLLAANALRGKFPEPPDNL